MSSGKPLPPHIWQIAGKDQDGPNVLVLGGTHGNELTGIALVRELLRGCKLINQKSGVIESNEVRGNLFVGFGNTEAMVRGTRAASEGRDLNRSFVTTELRRRSREDDSLDLMRARELAPLLRQTDILLDIHATSAVSVPFVCMGNNTVRCQELYQLVPVKYVITDPRTILGSDLGLTELGTTDYWVNSFGGSAWSRRRYGVRQGAAICYETGLQTDLRSVDRALRMVLHVLRVNEAVTPAFLTRFGLTYRNLNLRQVPQEVYALCHSVDAQAANFTYERGMDRSWIQVTKGQVVGHYADGTPETLTKSGMLVFPTGVKQIRKGRKLYYLAERIH